MSAPALGAAADRLLALLDRAGVLGSPLGELGRAAGELRAAAAAAAGLPDPERLRVLLLDSEDALHALVQSLPPTPRELADARAVLRRIDAYRAELAADRAELAARGGGS